VEQLANHIGWGYGDYVREQVAMLENELAEPENILPELKTVLPNA